ncbi:energy-coupling factor transporter transmembrane protein EcfT [bacterium]|nr:energy-coupling factor transporter transmembrane protein EcfT [bacterium]
MNRNFVLGQYVPGNSYLYRLDPRVKIISTILLMVSVFFLTTYYEILGALGVILLILLSGRISIIKAIRGLKPLLVLSLFVFFFQIFFNQTGTVIYTSELVFSISSIVSIIVLTFLFFFIRRFIKFKFILLLIYLASIYLSLAYLAYPNILYSYTLNIFDKGLETSLFVFFRLITVVFIATILTLTTKPTDLTLGIEYLLKPLKVFKINSEEIALIITIALRYIPTILEEAYRIMDAQASRGADFNSGSLFKKIKIIVSLLIPMFIISFERSDELADAMLSRNFVPGKEKTKYHILRWKAIDTMSLVLSFILLGGSICLFIIV